MAVLVALTVVGATACTPEEVQFWLDFHREQPAEAEALLMSMAESSPPATEPSAAEPPSAGGLSIVVPQASTTPLPRSAAATCPGTLSLTNTSGEAYTYAAVYGPNQWPIVAVDPSTADYPLLQPGETVTVDVSAGVTSGYPVNVYLDRGYAFDVTGSC